MPRKAKTQSGAPAQPVNPIPPQQYGQQVQTTEMQQAMPTPDNRAMPVAAGAPVPAAPAGPPQQPQPVDLMQIAKMMQGTPGLLRQPPTPGRPITAGLRTGPGPGPEVLPNMRPRIVDIMTRLSQATGDPYFAQLAQKVGRR